MTIVIQGVPKNRGHYMFDCPYLQNLWTNLHDFLVHFNVVLFEMYRLTLYWYIYNTTDATQRSNEQFCWQNAARPCTVVDISNAHVFKTEQIY